MSTTELVPTIGVRQRGSIGDVFSVVGRIGYFVYQDDSCLDAEVRIEYPPLPMPGIFAGRYAGVVARF